MRFFSITALTLSAVFLFSGVFSQPSKYEGRTVKRIDFYGLKNVDREDLMEIMKTTVGYPLRSSEVREDIKDIFNKGVFESITVEIEDYQGGVHLRFICKERPTVMAVEFKGTDEIAEADLTTSVAIKEGDSLRKDFLEKSVRMIKAKYDSEGLFNAIVTYRIKPVEDEENQVKVIFIIDEGEEIKVQKISILGANKIYVKEIMNELETSEDGIFQDGAFKKDIFEQDKTKILGYYRERGFLDAQIIDESVEYEWVDPSKKEERGIYITLKISEGERYYFDGYTVKINRGEEKPVFTVEEIMSGLEMKGMEGEVFDDTVFQKDRQSISFLYASRGYIFARVIPKRTVEEREINVEQDSDYTGEDVKIKKNYVKIDFVIDEGSKAYIDQIIIKGNTKTKDKVIRRELLVKEGELFDARKMQISREAVSNLGFFKVVNVDLRPGGKEGYMNLIIDVEEQPTGTISLGGGYGTTSGFSIFADIGENNLLGYGQRVGCKFEYGPLRSAITLTFSERWFLDYPVGFSASLFYNLYTIETSSIFPNSSAQAEYQKQSLGYSLGFSYRWMYYYTFGTIWSHAFISYLNPTGNCSDNVFLAQSLGVQQKRTVTFYTYRDSRDNYMNPTRGVRVGCSVAFTGGVLLGGEDHFIKYAPEFYAYFSPFHLPFLETHPCVFEFRINGTFIQKPWDSAKIEKKQPYETNEWLEWEDRLKIGGPETIRGWDYYDYQFPDSWANVGLYHRLLYGLEFRVPIHPQMLWIAFFFDAGSLWSDKFWESQLNTEYRDTVDMDMADKKLYRIDQFFDLNRDQMLSYFKYSYGFGFKIQIPMMPLRFWFGRKMIYDGEFRTISGFTFQFGIGDYRF